MPTDFQIPPQKIVYELNYCDNSGVSHAVRYDGNGSNDRMIELESIDTIYFETKHLDWLIGCLTEIKSLIDKQNSNL